MSNSILPPVAPALPTASASYNPDIGNRFAKTLRIYFNKIDSTFRELILRVTALSSSVISLSNAVQSVAVINTPTLVAASPSMIAFADGIFAVRYAVNLSSTNASTQTATFWLRVNGVDVPNSSSRVSIVAGGTATASASPSTPSSLKPGDLVEVWWMSSATTVTISPVAAGTAPGAPAFSASLVYVNAL